MSWESAGDTSEIQTAPVSAMAAVGRVLIIVSSDLTQRGLQFAPSRMHRRLSPATGFKIRLSVAQGRCAPATPIQQVCFSNWPRDGESGSIAGMDIGYNQFCPIAKASEVFATRWTPLILRELMADVHTFNDIHRGVPLISRAVLVARLRELEDHGLVERRARAGGNRP